MAITPSTATRPSNVISTAATAAVTPASRPAIEDNYILIQNYTYLMVQSTMHEICSMYSICTHNLTCVQGLRLYGRGGVRK